MDRENIKEKVNEFLESQRPEREYLVAKKVLVEELMKVIDPENQAVHNCLKILDDIYKSCFYILPDNTRIYLCDENIETHIVVQNVMRSIGLGKKEG